MAQNAVVEALVLHTRVLCEILLARAARKDDITLPRLLPAFASTSVATLDAAYGGPNDEHTPCWQFNKLMAHATTHRSDSHEYLPALKAVLPIVARLLQEVTKARGLKP